MKLNKAALRRLHRRFAPFMVLPLLVTLLTGVLFQVAVVIGNSSDFLWLLEWHRGKFGRINLEIIYPFLNAFGLLMLIVTGIIMWLQIRPKKI
jgi:hypothetical protein